MRTSHIEHTKFITHNTTCSGSKSLVASWQGKKWTTLSNVYRCLPVAKLISVRWIILVPSFWLLDLLKTCSYNEYTKTVHGHKYSSSSIFYYIFHIKPHFFKKYFKANSGQTFMKFISRHAEFFEFYLFI